MEKAVFPEVISISPLKTSSQIEMENIQKIPISKFNISTQVSLNQKKNELKLSDNSVITEKALNKKENIDICYNSNNNFEYNLLSDDNASSELLDQIELDKISSNNQSNQNQLKISDMKKQLKN